jgi:hypothetical protein
MSATMSFLRAWIYGIGGFIVATAALTVAMAVAITGPPTASEMAGLQAFLSRAGDELVAAADDVGAEACVQVPELCAPERGTVTAQTSSAEAEPVGATEAPLVAPEIEVAPPQTSQEVAPSNDVALLGAAGGDERVLRERPRAEPRAERRRASAERRVERRATPTRRTRDVRRAPRPPVAVARVESYSALPDAPASPLEELISARTPEVSPEPELPTQSEAEPVRERPTQWEAEPADEAYPEDEPAYEDEAYEAERIYAEREARRRYRERARAYREWRRQSESW